MTTAERLTIELARFGTGITQSMTAATGLPDLMSNTPLLALRMLDVDGPARPNVIAGVVGLAGGGTTKLLDRLEEAGLIERAYGVLDDGHIGRDLRSRSSRRRRGRRLPGVAERKWCYRVLHRGVGSQQGDIVKACGDASVDGPAATIDDNFRIGSITKTFTATVVLQLIGEGELALTDTVADLLPDFAVDYPDLTALTVEQLLSMTSGVADYLNVPDSVVADIIDDPTRVWGIEELIAAGVAAGVDAPGTPGYSTTNYLILQLIVEMVADTPLADLTAERATGPLGLDAPRCRGPRRGHAARSRQF